MKTNILNLPDDILLRCIRTTWDINIATITIDIDSQGGKIIIHNTNLSNNTYLELEKNIVNMLQSFANDNIIVAINWNPSIERNIRTLNFISLKNTNIYFTLSHLNDYIIILLIKELFDTLTNLGLTIETNNQYCRGYSYTNYSIYESKELYFNFNTICRNNV